MTRIGAISVVVLVVAVTALSGQARRPPVDPALPGRAAGAASDGVAIGQTRTMRADGGWITIGGEREGQVTSATMLRDGLDAPLRPGEIQIPRAWHTATALPTGQILIVGGIGVDGSVVTTAELFDPESGTSVLLDTGMAPTPRVLHTATAMIDGSVVFAGGLDASGVPTASVERWSLVSGTQSYATLLVPRFDHEATLLSDGTILLWGGTDSNGASLGYGELYDPFTNVDVVITNRPIVDPSAPVWLEDVVPSDGSRDVDVDGVIGLQFSRPLAWGVTPEASVVIEGRGTRVSARTVISEDGMLAFLVPTTPLRPGTTYTIRVREGAVGGGSIVVSADVTFTTADRMRHGDRFASTSDDETVDALDLPGDQLDWIPDATHSGGWRTDREQPSWQTLHPLQAPKGVTALAGQVLGLDGEPIVGVRLSIDDRTARTDATGRFLLSGLAPGRHELLVDGKKRHGLYEIGVEIAAGSTTALPYVVWLPTIDHAHEVRIPSPTTVETVLTTPYIPGLEVRIPAGTVLRDHDGEVVTRISITPIPVNRPPYPLPDEGDVPIYFTVQPGGAYLSGSWSGARIVYPNYYDKPSGTRFNFWHYDPEERGWYVYGQGSVRIDRRQIVPDPGLSLYELTGAMVMAPPPGGGPGGNCPPSDCTCKPKPGGDGPDGGDAGDDGTGGVGPGVGTGGGFGSGGGGIGGFGAAAAVSGDSPAAAVLAAAVQESGMPRLLIGPNGSYDGAGVSLPSGLMVVRDVDLYLPDTLPIVFMRTHRQKDGVVHPFGLGGTHTYEIYLLGDPTAAGDGDAYNPLYLVLPDGERVRYDRTSGTTSQIFFATWTSLRSSRRYFGSTLRWNNGPIPGVWELTLPNGTVFTFPDSASQTRTAKAALIGVRDRFGNATRLVRNATTGNLLRVESPNGRWIALEYTDAAQPDVITRITDSLGREVRYTYDSTNHSRLVSVQDVVGGITTYTWDGASERLTSIRTARQNFECPMPGCSEQPFVSISYYSAAAGLKAQRVQQQTFADGNSYQFDYTIDSGTGVTTSATTINRRGVQRRVEFNSATMITRDVRAVGTTEERERTYDVDSTTDLVVAQTDPLVVPGTSVKRRTEYQIDSLGGVTRVRELAGTSGQVDTTFTYEPRFHQLSSVRDPLGHVTTIDYDPTDIDARPVAIVDATQRRMAFGIDGPRRLRYFDQPVLLTDAAPTPKRFAPRYDGGDLVAFADPTGRETSFVTDAGGRVRLIRDAAGALTRIDYDAFNHPTRIVEPLGGETFVVYDRDGNITSVRDPRGKTTTFTYDRLNRQTRRTDPLTKFEQFSYDEEGKVQVYIDRRNNAAKFTYDKHKRVATAAWGGTPPNGTGPYERELTLTWDAGDRLTNIADSAGYPITRTFDARDNLLTETTTEGTISYVYDAAHRRTLLTHASRPAPLLYVYDDANRLTSIYEGFAIQASWTYDAAGRPSTMTRLGTTTVSYGYDDASRLTSLLFDGFPGAPHGLTYAYDAAGRVEQASGDWARTVLPGAVAAATTSYDDANRILTWNSVAYGYDFDGNSTNDGTSTLAWNDRGELASVTGPTPAQFTYDPFGRRVKKTIGGTITRFAYDGYNVIDERNNSGTSVASTLTGLQLDELLLRTDANGTQGYLTDLIGSTLALSGSSGVSTEYTYGPYGATSQSGPASANTFRYTGREEDPPGLYYYRSRYYSPQTGRFLSEDSIRFRSGDYSLCRYARNSPVMFRDPSGHQIGVPGFGGAGLPPGDFGFPPGPLAPPDSGCPPGDWSDIIAPIDHAIGILLWGRGMAGGGFECPLCGPPTPKPGTGPFPNDPPGT